MKKVIIFFLTLFFSSVVLNSQNTNNIWFGGFWGQYYIDFNQSPSSINIIDDFIRFNEASAAICDPTSGELILVANHEEVYNKEFQIIENGGELFGSSSTYQGTIILPHPCGCNKYYVIQNDIAKNDFNGNESIGLSYSLVDMNLNDGKGRVIDKNNIISDNVSEGMIAVSNTKNGYWLITHEVNSYNYVIHGIDIEGVKSFHQIFPSSEFVEGPTGTGSFASSIIGNKIAFCQHSDNQFIELLDFNPETGYLESSLPLMSILNDTVQFYPYSVEFSPDNSKLYAADEGRLVQYNLESENNDYEILFDADTSNYVNNLRGLQLGPDNKIYVNETGYIYSQQNNDDHLEVHGIIEDPNKLSYECNFNPTHFTLPFIGGRGGLRFTQIYKFAYSNKYTSMNQRNQLDISFSCSIDYNSLVFTSNIITDSITSILWSFGDSTFSTELNPVKLYDSSGNYQVSLEVANYYGCKKYFTKNVEITLPPEIQFEYKIYPNPSNNELSIESPDSILEISILSTNGKVLINKEYEEDSNFENIELIDLPSGIYILVVNTENKIYKDKFVVIHN